MAENKKISTAPYKGVRDFYPEDQFIQNYILGIWKATAERFGYREYNASILEPAELYRGKTSDEIVNEQTYTFTDRGGREVTLRPEMTPTVARMIAGKRRELSFPLRWFSIPNVFRYERPQKGRLREHWQLNVDAFGLEGQEIEIEVLSVAHEIMRTFGLKDGDFEIKINDRKGLTDYLKEEYGVKEDKVTEFLRLLDRKNKMNDFDEQAEKILGKPFKSSSLKIDALESIIEKLKDMGISNVVFDPTIVRGFDYYTGLVFEIFDTNPENNRSLFGGGRYDRLVEMFNQEPIPAVGFGMGDVTIRQTLEERGLLPPYSPPSMIYICTISPELLAHAQKLARKIRTTVGHTVEVDLSEAKIGNQLKNADKAGALIAIILGEDEVKDKNYSAKNLRTGEEFKVSEEKVVESLEAEIERYYKENIQN